MAPVNKLLNMVAGCEIRGRLRCGAASIGYRARIRKPLVHNPVTRLSRNRCQARNYCRHPPRRCDREGGRGRAEARAAMSRHPWFSRAALAFLPFARICARSTDLAAVVGSDANHAARACSSRRGESSACAAACRALLVRRPLRLLPSMLRRHRFGARVRQRGGYSVPRNSIRFRELRSAA
jgi:hypothetical protein